MKNKLLTLIPQGIVKRRNFLFFWIFVVSMATLIGSLLGHSITTFLWIVSGFSWSSSTGNAIWTIAINDGSIGVSVAIAQWLLIRRDYIWATDWLRATFIGVAISVIILTVIGILIYDDLIVIAGNRAYYIQIGAIWGAILGLSCGLLQGFELSKYYLQKYRWVLASTIGWMIGGTLPSPILLGIVSGVVTGIAFCQIVESPKNNHHG